MAAADRVLPAEQAFALAKLTEAALRVRRGELKTVADVAEAFEPYLPDPVDHLARRRRVLRLIWRNHYRSLARTPAAKRMAADWAAVVAAGEETLPGTPADLFAGLHRAGIAPVSWRTLVEDLDEAPCTGFRPPSHL